MQKTKEQPTKASEATDGLSAAALRAEAWAGEPFLREGEDPDRVLAPGTSRRRALDDALAEIEAGRRDPSPQWKVSYGLMLGARFVSLYGRDTQHAFGHLGLINIMAWADPERGISAALITSGKPILYPELPRVFGVNQRITSEAPKVS